MASSHNRRSTDHPPLANVVTRGNLDDRLDTVNQRMVDHQEMAVERWASHKAVHDAVAESLRDYKRDANEWRSTLSDLRLTFIPKAEFLSEHRALGAQLHGEIQAMAALVAALDTRIDVNTTDIKTISTDREARRSLFSDSRSVALFIIATIGILLAVLDRLPRA
jgi:hypothetical protein